METYRTTDQDLTKPKIRWFHRLAHLLRTNRCKPFIDNDLNFGYLCIVCERFNPIIPANGLPTSWTGPG